MNNYYICYSITILVKIIFNIKYYILLGRCECDGDNFKGFLCDECANGFTGPKCRVNIGNSTEHMFTSDQMTIRLQLPWKHIYLNLDERESKLLSYDISNKVS